MTLNEVKKSEVDEVSSVEKIILATNAITWMATRSERILRQLKTLKGSQQNADSVIAGIVDRHEKSLSDAVESLTKVAEVLGNFLSNEDASDDIDTVVTMPAFDILYERYAPTINP